MTEGIMEQEKLNEVEKRLEKLTRIELEYFRDWLMNHYPIYGMDHDIGTIIGTMDGVGAKYEEIDSMLRTISDHSKWEIEESVYKEEEESGYYRMIELEIELDNLSKNEWVYFEDILEKRYPGYVGSTNYYIYVKGTSGGEGEPTVEEVFEVIKEVKNKSK